MSRRFVLPKDETCHLRDNVDTGLVSVSDTCESPDVYSAYANIFFRVAPPFADDGTGSDVEEGRLTLGGDRFREHCLACVRGFT